MPLEDKKPTEIKETRDIGITLPEVENENVDEMTSAVEVYLDEIAGETIKEETVNTIIASRGKVPDEIFMWSLIRHSFNATQAYKYLYPNVSDDSARVLASKRISRLKDGELFNGLYEMALKAWADTMKQSVDYKAKMKAVEYVFDRTLGKATEKQDVNVTGAVIHLGVSRSQFIKPEEKDVQDV